MKIADIGIVIYVCHVQQKNCVAVQRQSEKMCDTSRTSSTFPYKNCGKVIFMCSIISPMYLC